MTTTLPTYFMSHGGGPWTHMRRETGNMYDALEASLRDIPRELGGTKPKAVLVVSGHWEEAESEKAYRIYHEDAVFGGVVVSSYRFGDELAAT